MITFQAWPKTPRLFRDMVVTEKLDGTNAAVIIEDAWDHLDDSGRSFGAYHLEYIKSWVAHDAKVVEHDGRIYLVGAQSRKQLVTPGKSTDNHGFAGWVYEHAADLVALLGPGRHFGEWWGSGINRGYGLTGGEKRFSLFNVNRYAGISGVFKDIDLVPTLAEGPFDLDDVRHILRELEKNGSSAAPGFMRPEGVVVYHTAARQTFKALIENDEAPKGSAS
ncbi:hypothetical protein OG474_09730 [Kribbella sp. NBC_01505]|uniref:RNA ligase family protein n=1 Tax=Kribbella sp. NBC_01505 TaxID=2903580 RepID=UPI00386B5A56